MQHHRKILLLEIIILLLPYAVFAQVNVSMYPMGNSPYATYLRNSQQQPTPIYIPPPQPVQPMLVPQQPGGSGDPRGVFMGTPAPVQRVCTRAGNNTLICN